MSLMGKIRSWSEKLRVTDPEFEVAEVMCEMEAVIDTVAADSIGPGFEVIGGDSGFEFTPQLEVVADHDEAVQAMTVALGSTVGLGGDDLLGTIEVVTSAMRVAEGDGSGGREFDEVLARFDCVCKEIRNLERRKQLESPVYAVIRMHPDGGRAFAANGYMDLPAAVDKLDQLLHSVPQPAQFKVLRYPTMPNRVALVGAHVDGRFKVVLTAGELKDVPAVPLKEDMEPLALRLEVESNANRTSGMQRVALRRAALILRELS